MIDPEIVYSTYLGGTKNGANEFVTQTEITSLTVDSAGNTYVTGETNAVDFPVTPNARQHMERDEQWADEYPCQYACH